MNEITTTQLGVNIKELKELRERIGTLGKCENIELLKILLKNNVKYTENKNGIFINMNKLEPKCIDEIKNFLEFVKNNLNNI